MEEFGDALNDPRSIDTGQSVASGKTNHFRGNLRSHGTENVLTPGS